MGSEEQRKKNADYKRAYRAKKKAEAEGIALSADNIPLESIEPGIQVEVNVPEQAPQKQSLADKILGKINIQKAPAAKKTTRPSKAGNNLLSNTLPTIVAAFIATYSKDMIRDPYKPCAPSQDECSAMLAPLFAILAREIEVTGKASQNTIDLINAVICMLMYGIRAYITASQIKEMSNATASNSASNARADQGSLHRIDPNWSSSIAATEAATTSEIDAAISYSNSADGATEGEAGEAAIISEMFRRDVAGRRRLGLLPTAI